jgi:hypothetical protein
MRDVRRLSVTVPPRLYKYESWSLQALENLKRQVIYFGSPRKFNDPYDCALLPNLEELTDLEVEQLRSVYLERPDIPHEARQQFTLLDTSSLKATLMRASRAGFEKTISEFLDNRGVACFSEKNDDLLMWSHYGGSYKGFCLEFDTQTAAFERVRQVTYTVKPPTLSVANVLPKNIPDDIVSTLFCTKSESWAYEKEWRALHKTAGTSYCYESSVLTGVYFGPDIDPQSMDMVCLILRGQNEHVKFWRGERSTSEFKVKFSTFAYMTYLEGKAKGLV